jgi:hypothetical protein
MTAFSPHIEAKFDKVANCFRRQGGARHMASDMMEALFLGDPGFFLSLDDGVKYWLWRRTLLQRQGKNVLTGRLFPHFPIFKFDFNTCFPAQDQPTGRPYVVDASVKRGTYTYFYTCWRRKAFPSSKDGPQGPETSSELDLLGKFLWKSGFWASYGPLAEEISEQGARLRNVTIHNIILHLDIAYQKLHKREIKDRDDAMAYVEASAEFWIDENWKRPEAYVPTPAHHRGIVQNQQIPLIYPYAISTDEHVMGREPRIHRTHLPFSEDARPNWVIRLEQAMAKGNASGPHEHTIRPVTKEEADFMCQFLVLDDESNTIKDVEMVDTPGNDDFTGMMEDLDMVGLDL